MSLLDGIRAVVFDMDGVLRIGNTKLDGSERIFNKLAKADIKSMIVTNECRYTVKELKDDLYEMGVSFKQLKLFPPYVYDIWKKVLKYP